MVTEFIRISFAEPPIFFKHVWFSLLRTTLCEKQPLKGNQIWFIIHLVVWKMKWKHNAIAATQNFACHNQMAVRNNKNKQKHDFIPIQIQPASFFSLQHSDSHIIDDSRMQDFSSWKICWVVLQHKRTYHKQVESCHLIQGQWLRLWKLCIIHSALPTTAQYKYFKKPKSINKP